MKKNHRIGWVGLTLIAATLAGCGGNTSLPGTFSDLISLAGFAMKGKLQNAKVEAFAILEDGKLASTASASGTTDTDGRFKLSPEVSKKSRYVLKVTPNADTRHLDEVTNTLQPVGKSFVMQAIAPLTNVDTVKDRETVTVNLTPFSNQEVVAAQKETGGLSEDNIKKAKAVTKELYGFDPVQVEQDKKSLNVLLYAVSQMAKEGKLGCQASTEDPTCVVENLAKATQITTLKLKLPDGTDVSKEFDESIRTAVTEMSKTDASINSSTLLNITSKLNCTGDGCKPAAPINDAATTAISSIKAVLDEIGTDMRALFSNDGTTETSVGALNQQVYQFKKTVDDVNTQTNMVSLDSEALSLGGQLYLDYKNDPTTANWRSSSYGGLSNVASSGLSNAWWQGYPAVGCSLYQDDEGNNKATSKANANYVSCMARYAVTAKYDPTTDETTFNSYGHGFTLKPVPNQDGQFTYVSRARKHVWTCDGPSLSTNCSNPDKSTLGINIARTGTVTLGHPDGNGVHRSLQWNGRLPQSLSFNYNTPNPQAEVTGSDYYDVDLTMTPTFDGNELSTLTFTGVLSGTTGSSKNYEVTFETGTVLNKAQGTGELNLSLSAFGSTNTARFVGTMKADTPAAKLNGPAHFVLSGTFSNRPKTGNVNGTETQFLKGELAVAATNYANFNINAAESASNTFDVGMTFTGSVTAPNQPRLELVLGAAGKAYNFDNTPNTVSLTYNRYVGSAKTRAVNLNVTNANTPTKSITLTEASSGLSIVHNTGQTVVDVKAHGTKVGVLNTDNSMFTFADNTLTSLDLWP